MRINYINLTNGIEAIPKLKDYRFIRIQSTACEQKRWDFILQDLDNDLLMNLALGNECYVYDYGHSWQPRALWQGLEFIRYALFRVWYDKKTVPFTRNGMNVSAYFNQIFIELSDRTIKKLAYYKRFIASKDICLVGCWDLTNHDGQYDWYVKQLFNSR